MSEAAADPTRNDPARPLRKPIQVRLPEDIYDRMAAIAAEEDRSLNAQIVRALREWLAFDPTES